MKSPLRLLAGCLLAATSVFAAEKTSRPNILLLLADDLGWSDLGCYGSEIRTPNLDALAADGLRFTEFYSAARCSPSRASILTGLYPQEAGIGILTNDQKLPGYRGALQPNCVTIAQVLKPAGYRTAALGKWHVSDQVLPTARGFDDFYGFVRGYGVNSWEPRMMIRLPAGRPQRSYAEGEYYATDAITDHALDFLAEARKSPAQPWFFYVAYQAPHFPLHAKPADMAGYPEVYAQGWDRIREARLARQKKLCLLPADTPLTPRSRIPQEKAAQLHNSMTPDGNNPAWDSLPEDRRADLAQRMSVFAGMVTGMDRNIGRLLADLRTHGELENTLIFFLSDNGACAEWEPYGFDLPIAPVKEPGTGTNQGTQTAPNFLHKGEELKALGGPRTAISYGSAWANVGNTPFRLYKHFDHEGGISTPLIVHWPVKIKETGALRSQVGHIVDLMATCAEVGEAKYPREFEGHQISPPEGVSLLPAFAGQPLAREYLAWEHEGNRALRMGDWKIVAEFKGPWELYDLSRDRVEMNNLASTDPKRVEEMAARWEEWAKRTQVYPAPPELLIPPP